MHGWNITCGNCGSTSPASSWVQTVMGDLPKGDLQCPDCKVAIRRVVKSYKKIGHGKYERIVPERVEVIKIQSRL